MNGYEGARGILFPPPPPQRLTVEAQMGCAECGLRCNTLVSQRDGSCNEASAATTETDKHRTEVWLRENVGSAHCRVWTAVWWGGRRSCHLIWGQVSLPFGSRAVQQQNQDLRVSRKLSETENPSRSLHPPRPIRPPRENEGFMKA